MRRRQPERADALPTRSFGANKLSPPGPSLPQSTNFVKLLAGRASSSRPSSTTRSAPASPKRRASGPSTCPGNVTSAARIGRPDLGLLTLTEMAQHARGIASAVDLPVLADADTGYGDAAMVARTVAEFEAAGVAGIHLEDQALPKRCGAMPGVRLAPLDEALERVRAALGARSNPEFVIVARTDALVTDDYPEALRRAQAFAEAGADLVFVEDPRSAEDVERLPRDLDGIPLMIDVFETWPWTQRPVQELEQLGYKLAIYCLSATLAYAYAAREVFRTLREAGQTRACEPRMLTRQEYEAVLGLDLAEQPAESPLPA